VASNTSRDFSLDWVTVRVKSEIFIRERSICLPYRSLRKNKHNAATGGA
jgi:hypothetical protein